MEIFSIPTKELLNAQIAQALVVMVIIMVLALYAFARLLVPLIKGNADALERLRSVIVGQTTSNDRQTAEIAALRDDFNSHMVQINLRFDQLPHEFQAMLGAEFARQTGQRVANRQVGIVSRLLGLN